MAQQNKERKIRTPERVARMQQKAVTFLRNVVGNDELADEIEDLSLEEYAERKRIRIQNRKGGERQMASKRELEEQVRELEERNGELEDALAAIGESVDSALPEDDSEDEDEDDDE